MKQAETNQLNDILITFEPAKVAFSDFEAFEKGIEQAVAQYGTFDLEVNTIEEVKQARADLNKLSKSLEDRRKEIKGQINEPYAEFEKLYKQPYAKLKNLIDTLKTQIDGYEEQQKKLRMDTVRRWFAEKAAEGNLNPEVFDEYLADYTKAGQFKKDSFELLKKTEAELEKIVLAEIEKQNQRDADIAAISAQAAKNDLGPASYIRLYDTGRTLAEILQVIDKDAEMAQLARLQREAKAKAEAERQAEIERLAQESAQAQIKAYDAETGEILESGTNTLPESENATEGPKKANPAKYKTTIRFWFDLEQANKFKQFLGDNDIEFETVEGMQKVE